jgi:hypothetical protein
MTKEQLNDHIAALVGSDKVENWWNSPNKNWNGFTPIEIYESDAEGKQQVEEYILKHCYGGW